LRKGETRSRCVRLLGGLMLWISSLYCAPSRRPPKAGQEHGGGLHPELAVFGLYGGNSAALASMVARNATLMPSFELARKELARRGTKLGIKTVQRTTHGLGWQLLIARRQDLQRFRDGLMPAGSEFAGKRVCVQIDGGRIRLRKATRKQKGKGKAKKQTRRYKGEWREPKLVTIFEIGKDGRMVPKSRARIDGTFAGPDEVMELVAMHLHRMGAAKAEVVAFLADGAPWIWERLGWVARRVGLDEEKVTYTLDWCHALHHVGLALAAVGLAKDEHKRVFKKFRKWLKKGEAAGVLNELDRLGEKAGLSWAMETPMAYLDKHLEAGRLEYDAMAEQGLPIGSGAIESAVRRVVNQRLKGNGMMWLEGNAEGMLALRAAALTDRWDETMEEALRSSCEDGNRDWHWDSPDMPLQLKAGGAVTPKTTQVQSNQGDRIIPP
jgi:hypothetical protein